MFTKSGFAFVVMVLAVIIGGVCFAADPVPTQAPATVASIPGFPMTIEVENFKITNGVINDRKDASNGKVVVATDLSFTAATVVSLKKGLYEVAVYEDGVVGSGDAINIKYNENGGLRIFPLEASYGTIVPCIKKLMFQVKDAGDQTITLFTSNEKGAMYDKVVINCLRLD